MLKNNKNNKIKKLLALSAFSSVFLVSGVGGSAMMKKTLTSGAGAASSVLSSSSSKMASVGRLSTWSSHKARMSAIKSKNSSLQSQAERSKHVKPIEGKFVSSSGNEILVNVYSKISEEGLRVNYVKTNDGDEVVVTSLGDGFYARTLSLDELKFFDSKNHGFLNTGTDILGREHIIVVADGNSGGEVAYQFSNGTWREVRRGRDRTIYLGSQIDITSFSEDLRNKLFGDIKEIINSSSMVGLDVPKTSSAK